MTGHCACYGYGPTLYAKRKKDLFLKLAVPKKQAKSLKATCEELHFYCIGTLETLLKITGS